MNQADWNSHINSLLEEIKPLWSSIEKIPNSNWERSNPKSWNGLETLNHINISLIHYSDKLEPKVKTLQVQSFNQYKPGWAGKLMIKAVKPGSKSISTIKTFTPSITLVNQELIDLEKELFSKNLLRYENLLKLASNKNINSTKVNSAIGPLMRFTAGSAIEFMLLHTRRHLLQLKKTLIH